MNQDLDDLRQKLKQKAHTQKQKVRKRLFDLKGTGVITPSRGPIQKNGRKCIRWHFWQASIKKHKRITNQITAISPIG